MGLFLVRGRELLTWEAGWLFWRTLVTSSAGTPSISKAVELLVVVMTAVESLVERGLLTWEAGWLFWRTLVTSSAGTPSVSKTVNSLAVVMEAVESLVVVFVFVQGMVLVWEG